MFADVIIDIQNEKLDKIFQYRIPEEIEDRLKPGMEVNVTEGVLPSSYYYMIEHALGMSANFRQAERLKTRRGVVKELKETPQFHIAVLEFDE